MGVPLRVCTFNVRVDVSGDGPDNWHRRRSLVTRVLNDIRTDVICLQEPLPHQFEWIADRVDGIDWYGVPRRGHKAGERVAVGWRTDRFDPVTCETRWLSETPDRPSTGWDADIPRTATAVGLLDWDRDGAPIEAWGTHFDHQGATAQAESARLLAQWCPADTPAVVLGDFNVPRDDPPMGHLVEAGDLTDARDVADEVAGPTGTYHGFDGDPRAAIDHVFVSETVGVERVETVADRLDGRYPSDHFPIVADLTLSD